VPLPRWLAQLNKRTFNKMEIKRGNRPVLSHVGRASGKAYETPLDPHAVEGGYIFIANYGRDSDWVKNILAAGTAALRVDGDEVALVSPRMVPKDEARQQMAAQTKWPPHRMNVTECLRMDIDR
jgi:deazaflavin-dependent oxidoreductase (nitroreductase family)